MWDNRSVADPTNPTEREQLLQRLGDAMSDLQEACFCASWMCVTPTIVGLCRKTIRTGRPQGWGNGELSVECAKEMWALAERLGGWPRDSDPYVIDWPFTPLDATGLEGEDISWHR